MKIKLSWTSYGELLNQLVDLIKKSNEHFDVIIGLTRGGLLPAVALSHELKTPMVPFDPHVLHANGIPRETINLPISPSVIRKVLIVDDISDSGKTLNKTVNFFQDRGFKIKTVTVYTNNATCYVPDFTLKDVDNWIIFPYEVKE